MTQSSQPTSVAATGGQFVQAVEEAMGQVRLALSKLFVGYPGGIRKSRDAQKHLGIDSNLSWQLLKVLTTPDIVAAASFVPAPVSMRRVLDAATEKGVSSQDVQKAESALQTFEALVADHAGDRARFKSMIAGHLGTDQDGAVRKADLKNRRAVFNGHMYFWGMEVETRLVSYMVGPSQLDPNDTNRYDHVLLRSFVGLRRLRAEANMLVDRFSVQAVNPTSRPDTKTSTKTPMDPAGMDAHGAPLVEAFCSQPLPAFQSLETESGELRTELMDPAVGQSSKVDLTFANITRGATATPNLEGTGDMLGVQTRVWLPTKELIVHVLIHKDRHPANTLSPFVKVFGHALQTRPGSMRDGHGLLPFNDSLSYKGTGAVAGNLPHVPQHVPMLEAMAETGGWALKDFLVYRATIDYPLLDTSVVACVNILGDGPTNPLK